MKRDYRTAILVDATNSNTATAVAADATYDDEHSVSSDCSTIAVVAAKQQQQQQQTTTVVPRCSRRVHFNEAYNSVVVVYPTISQQQADAESTWYSQAELKQFKAQAYAVAREIHRLEGQQQQPQQAQPTFTAVVEATYDACRRAPCETTTASLSLPTAHQQLQGLLHKWMRVGASRWGLERISVRAVAADRRQRRAGMVEAVLELQAILAFRPDCDEVIAKTCEIWSRPSRLFARELAVAAAAAV